MKRFAKVFLGISAALVTLLVASAVAHAQTAEVGTQYIERDKWVAIAAGFGIAVAAFGGALSQGRTASTALDGIARNPGAADKLFTPMIIGLALTESLVLLAFLIAYNLQNKIG